MCAILVDDNKVNPIISKENSILKFLYKSLKHYLSVRDFIIILPSGIQPGKVHSLAKVHKEHIPLTSVVSMLETAEYHLATYLVSIINESMPNKYVRFQCFIHLSIKSIQFYTLPCSS